MVAWQASRIDGGVMPDAWEELQRFLTLHRAGGPGRCVSEPPPWPGPTLFGGNVIAQAVVAGTRYAPAGLRLHSMHASCVRPVQPSVSVAYEVDTVREGRTLTTRRVTARQSDKVVFDMSCSLTADTDGEETYDLPVGSGVPGPDGLPVQAGPGVWLQVVLGPTEARDDGTRASTHRKWCRVGVGIPEDPHLHTALRACATDMTGMAGRPHQVGAAPAAMVSLDHAVWFSRPTRADRWLLHDVHCLVSAGGRSLIRGTLSDEDGRIVVASSQEIKLTARPG